MAIDTKCPGCGQLLRVDDEHAGRDAACPVCRTVYVVPQPPAAPAADDSGCWSLRTPEGQMYGPVSKAVLDEWLLAGRITTECRVREGAVAPWRPADECYPVLRVPGSSTPAAPSADPAPGAGSQAALVMPAAAGLDSVAAWHRVPHRGPFVLTIGVLSWVFTCPVFSIMAWVMGNSDLREIRAGRMNPAGAALTQAGRILGMISALLWVALLVVGFFLTSLVTALRWAP